MAETLRAPPKISLNRGATEIKGFDLVNLNPIYKRELSKPDVHQRKGMWKVSMCGEGGIVLVAMPPPCTQHCSPRDSKVVRERGPEGA